MVVYVISLGTAPPASIALSTLSPSDTLALPLWAALAHVASIAEYVNSFGLILRLSLRAASRTVNASSTEPLPHTVALAHVSIASATITSSAARPASWAQ